MQAERARREAIRLGKVKTYRAADHLHAAQLAAHLLKDETGELARFRAFFAGRRGGKTTLVQHEMIEVATSQVNVAVVYIGPTINLAVKTVWDELVRWSEPYGGVPNQSNHWIKFPNGSVIYILGAETKTTIDRVRGIKRIAYLAWDEQQNYDSEFAIYGIGSVITPALADVRGRLVLLGTGGPPRGYWFDVNTKPELGYAVARWTIWDNPNIPDPEGEVTRACTQRGVTRQDPFIRREWGSKEKGIEFTTDSERSVFPRITSRPVELLPGGRYVIGADVGSVDKTAVAVYWLHRNYNGVVLVKSEKKKTAGSSDQIAFIRSYAESYSDVSGHEVFTAVDPGGGGRAVIEDLRRLGGFGEVLPAEKVEKAWNCRLMADDIRTGFLTVLPGNDDATVGLEALEWEPGKEGEKLRGHADDAADGALYGWRLAKKLFQYTPIPVDTRDEKQRELDAILSAQMAEMERIQSLGFA